METFLSNVQNMLSTVMQSQIESMQRASEVLANTLVAGRHIFVFGTGHSHMIAEEAFYRAGGLKDIIPILESGLMLHEGGVKSTKLERLEGYAAVLLDTYQVSQGDVLILSSNSGINAVPVEMALGAKERGATVIAITNLKQSMQGLPRHSSQLRCYEIANIVIDNCGVVGDASVYVEEMQQYIGPTSTIIGAFILNAIIVQTVKNCLAQGLVPPVYVSANVAKGDAHNAQLRNNPPSGGSEDC
ncbi:SIS domain-containing protein [Paenibacillus qinlingensis]|uniref:Phosphosugar-binding protein n=1 Tax=Paenibacillus qinlingensis TaxID=1837343 RepID=A0ABU1NNZ0_9BACL|nr:SIS domain-containing protein [Paenibacillus qinlingensis]MDR6549180.1 putative phosphosugar-binding protein [Paenibacillus qinlingensis]